jgi:hypothetical protein
MACCCSSGNNCCAENKEIRFVVTGAQDNTKTPPQGFGCFCFEVPCNKNCSAINGTYIIPASDVQCNRSSALFSAASLSESQCQCSCGVSIGISWGIEGGNTYFFRIAGGIIGTRPTQWSYVVPQCNAGNPCSVNGCSDVSVLKESTEFCDLSGLTVQVQFV